MAQVLAYLIFFAVVIGVLSKEKNSGTRRKHHYKKRIVMSEPEQVLYYRLKNALPEKTVFAQVGLSRIIEPLEKRDVWGFRSIAQKSIDFVICNPDSSIVVAIELDDSTHALDSRRKADETKDAALRSAGIRIIRWNVKQMPDTERIRAAVLEHL